MKSEFKIKYLEIIISCLHEVREIYKDEINEKNKFTLYKTEININELSRLIKDLEKIELKNSSNYFTIENLKIDE